MYSRQACLIEPEPRGVHEAWLSENADVFDFELTAEEMQAIDAL